MISTLPLLSAFLLLASTPTALDTLSGNVRRADIAQIGSLRARSFGAIPAAGGQQLNMRSESSRRSLGARQEAGSRKSVGQVAKLAVEPVAGPTYLTGLAYWSHATAGAIGACMTPSADSDLVFGLPTSLWDTSDGQLSPLCGKPVVIMNLANNKTVTAVVGDVSQTTTSILSANAFAALEKLEIGQINIRYFFPNSTIEAASLNSTALLSTASNITAPVAPAAARFVPGQASTSPATSTSAKKAPSASDAAPQVQAARVSIDLSPSPTPSPTTDAGAAKAAADAKSSSDAAAASSASAAQASRDAQGARDAQASRDAQGARDAQASRDAAAKPSPTPSPSPSPSPTKAPGPPKETPPPSSGGGGGETHSGGHATFYYQNGVTGACGSVGQDSDLIAAMDSRLYQRAASGKSELCDRRVKITRLDNGKSVTVRVADECPTCISANSIDLSVAAFRMIAAEAEGLVPITWQFA